MAAEALERQWIGIDLTYLAIGAVKTQAKNSFLREREAGHCHWHARR